MSEISGDAASPSAMFLRSVAISGFRSCADVNVPLSPGVTLLVGENNSGKSNIIEALRLATAPLSGRRSRYFDLDDVTRGHDGPTVITTRFASPTAFQRAHFIGALELDTDEIVYCTRFRPPVGGAVRGRVDQLVGEVQAPDPEPEKREQVNHVYLTPLRDAQRELDSYSGTRLARIIQHLTSVEDQQHFVATATEAMTELAGHPVVRNVQAAIQEHLADLTSPGREQVMDAAYDPPELLRLARNLRLKMAEVGLAVADLNESGLGYANLLFMATVILELQKSRESELTLFLVEEPEAHLHPQLQAVLLQFLAEQAAASVNDDVAQPAGRIQVIATTHSPNLASAVGIEDVVVLRPRQESGGATGVIPLAELPLTADERRKINQYLDASRSELLFARRAVLVEGIAEAVILPVLARKCVHAGVDPQNAAARRAFTGASLINVGSVDFKPYMKLMLAPVNGQRLVDKLVVVTDADPELPSRQEDPGEPSPEPESEGTAEGDQAAAHSPDHLHKPPEVAGTDGADAADDESEDLDQSAKYNRAEDLKALVESLDAVAFGLVVEAPHTLEADLLEPGGDNIELLGKAYGLQKPKSSKQWAKIAGAEDPAQAFYERLRTQKKLISKGEFAHDIAQLIDNGWSFTCPNYLEDAIRAITGVPKDA